MKKQTENALVNISTWLLIKSLEDTTEASMKEELFAMHGFLLDVVAKELDPKAKYPNSLADGETPTIHKLKDTIQ